MRTSATRMPSATTSSSQRVCAARSSANRAAEKSPARRACQVAPVGNADGDSVCWPLREASSRRMYHSLSATLPEAGAAFCADTEIDEKLARLKRQQPAYARVSPSEHDTSLG